MREYAVTNDMIRELILAMPSEFDSHALIQQVMRRHPREYTIDLYSFVDREDPIRSLHQSLGQRLLGFNVIEKDETGKVPSANVRGNDTDNQMWRRVGPR